MGDNPPRDSDLFESSSAGDEVPPPPPLDELLPNRQVATSRRTREGGWEEWLDLLNNRLVLSSLGLVAVLLLTAIVFLSIGRGDAGPSRSVSAVATSGGTPRPVGGLSGRVLATVSVRNGPNSVDILGTIPKSTIVIVVGRSDDSTWLQIRYPPNSLLRGWVDAQFLEVTGNILQLEIGAPGPSPSIEVPTEQPTYIQPEYTATPNERTATPTESPAPLTSTPPQSVETPTTTPATPTPASETPQP